MQKLNLVLHLFDHTQNIFMETDMKRDIFYGCFGKKKFQKNSIYLI